MIFATYNNIEEFLIPQADQPAYYNNPEPPTPTPTSTTTPKLAPYDGQEEEDRAANAIDEEYDFMMPEVEVMEFEAAEEETNQVLDDLVVNTNIISASINGRKEIKELPEPIIYVLEHKTVS